jgi:DNA-binding CsgD family transcriptional regulator
MHAAARARETYQAIGHHSLVAGSAMQELVAVLLPYRADRPRELQHAVATTEKALTLAGTAIGLPPRLAHLPLLSLRGEWAEARYLAVAGPIMHHTVLGIRSVLGPLARLQGDGELAWAQVRETLPDGPDTEPGDAHFLAALAMQRLAVALATDVGYLTTSHQWLEGHDRWLAWSGAVLGQSEGQLLWAEYYRAAGDPKRAHEHAMNALAHATAPRQPLALLVAHRLLGELASDAGTHVDAAMHLDTSLALADACAAPYERALTLLAFAALHIATHKRTEAASLIEEVRAICIPLGAKPALARADALATTLTDETKPTSAYPAGLSAREVEVLRLVADGLTNVQVAERLFLSPHTINSHLTAIYSKLGVPSRSAAIRFALEHDLR